MIALFVIFGAFLEKSGAGKIFIDLAFALTARGRGGPAKAAVVSSALMGTISGSAAANVAVTGTFTIPLMKRAGYESAFAGAVEAVASTGGQIMPPIMASAAFVMSELTGIPYIDICIAAAPSALLYFFTIFVMVHLRAVKLDLRTTEEENIPSFWPTLRSGIHLMLPFGVLVYLLARMYSPGFAAFWSVIATITVCMLRKSTRLNLSSFLESMRDGGVRMIEVGITCAVAGIIIGMINLTGLGVKISSLLITLSGGSLLALLFMTMVASIILGMGMPTVAAYLLLAVLVGPALISVGISTLQAHLFILYFGTISAITPPVALAAFTGAGIAKASPMKVGLNAVLLGIAAYIVPYMFVFNEALLFQGKLSQVILATLTALIGCACMAAGIQGQLLKKCHAYERAILIAAGLALIKPGILTDILGLGGLALVFALQRWSDKPR
jgi:TRAP transporter 4TM/12TM fusion protein